MNLPSRTSVFAAVRQEWFTVRHKLRGASQWSGLRGFCLFVGYGRSGHSAIASILDAHPRAAVSHELNALARYLGGCAREDLFAQIVWLTREQARAGRTSPRAEGGVYQNRIEGQGEKDPRQLLMIGDQKGARTARALAGANVHRLEDFQRFVALPLRMLHVIRNPYDIVAAGLARGSSGFPELVEITADLRRRQSHEHWLDVYHEDVIAHPRHEIHRILAFLGLPVVESHMHRCEAYLLPVPRRRRFDVEWPTGVRTEVARIIERHDFLHRYDWEH